MAVTSDPDLGTEHIAATTNVIRAAVVEEIRRRVDIRTKPRTRARWFTGVMLYRHLCGVRCPSCGSDCVCRWDTGNDGIVHFDAHDHLFKP